MVFFCYVSSHLFWLYLLFLTQAWILSKLLSTEDSQVMCLGQDGPPRSVKGEGAPGVAILKASWFLCHSWAHVFVFGLVYLFNFLI